MDFGDILRDESGSYVDYGGWYLYNPFEDEKTNEARKQAIEAEEAAERGRRERNYRKLAEFREMLRGKMNGSIQENVHAIEDIHKDKVIPFENTDDRYKKLIDTYYDEWKSFGDGFADFWDVVCDIGSGLFGAVKDLFVGVIDLLKGVVEIAGWLLLKVVQVDKIGLMPEALEEDVTGIFTGIGSILKDPGNALEAMGQSTFDNADEKGIAYSVSYVAADTAIGIFLDKGLKKLGKADDLVKPAGYSDEAADAAKYGDEAADAAMEAAERGDELAKGAEEVAGYADEGGTVPVVKTQKNVEMPLLPEGSQWERNVLNSFAGGKSTPVTYGGGTTLYRVGGKNGGFWSLDPPPATEYQWRVDFAIKQEFCNDASTLYKITIPEGSSLSGLEGIVGTQGMGLYGGAHQVYIDYRAVPSDWIEISPTNWK